MPHMLSLLPQDALHHNTSKHKSHLDHFRFHVVIQQLPQPLKLQLRKTHRQDCLRSRPVRRRAASRFAGAGLQGEND
jgi:hypothetical protein